jgi:hypothetical protein
VGRSILLGLEVLISADIVQTIAIDPTLDNAAALGVLVLVRTFLSVSLEIEFDGSLPWQGTPDPAPSPRPTPSPKTPDRGRCGLGRQRGPSRLSGVRG